MTLYKSELSWYCDVPIPVLVNCKARVGLQRNYANSCLLLLCWSSGMLVKPGSPWEPGRDGRYGHARAN